LMSAFLHVITEIFTGRKSDEEVLYIFDRRNAGFNSYHATIVSMGK